MFAMPNETVSGMQVGALSAVLHVALASSSAAREIAREFDAANTEIEGQLREVAPESWLKVSFAGGLPRPLLMQLVRENADEDRLLERVRASVDLIDAASGDAVLADYRSFVIRTALRAARAVKETGFFSWRRITRAEWLALKDICRELGLDPRGTVFRNALADR